MFIVLRKILKYFIVGFVFVYMLFFSKETAYNLAGIILFIAFLDRLAVWADRNVPDSDPRKCK